MPARVRGKLLGYWQYGGDETKARLTGAPGLLIARVIAGLPWDSPASRGGALGTTTSSSLFSRLVQLLTGHPYCSI